MALGRRVGSGLVCDSTVLAKSSLSGLSCDDIGGDGVIQGELDLCDVFQLKQEVLLQVRSKRRSQTRLEHLVGLLEIELVDSCLCEGANVINIDGSIV